jgi:NADH:ubiquinone oxidoreductase subunit C
MAFLFQNKNEKEIHSTCKLCLSDVKFTVTLNEYQNTSRFPLIKESIHGTPPHKLIVYLDKNLEIAEFKIEDLLDKEVSYSKELTYQVLSDIQLNEDEIKLYFLTTGRDAVSLGEMSLLIDKDKDECKQIADKFVEKGLYREIVGATPHYAPLPPYAALMKQLSNFDEYIRGIKEVAPAQLNESFSQLEAKSKGIKELNEYTTFIKNLNDKIQAQIEDQKAEVDNAIKIIGQIRKVNEVISNLENDTKVIIEDQVKDLEQQFEEIKALIANNLRELHLGVISKTVHQIIDSVLNARMKIIAEGFNTKLVTKVRDLIKNIVDNVNEITVTSAKTGQTLEETFSTVIKEFSKSVTYAEEKVEGISNEIMSSFKDLRDTFSSRVVNTLEQELLKILKRLEISQVTTKEFWDQAKKKSLMSMKDIWFIRSIEGARAHINEEIAKTKMRLLIVAPDISEIKVSLLESLPKHVNIRIATHIDMSNPEHVATMEQLDGMQNISYRNREAHDLFGINRDYEEVILCIISKTEMGKEQRIEIGGIGSIVQQHIKIFVPVLEEAWVGAQKAQAPLIRPSFAQKNIRSSTTEFSSSSTQTSPLKPISIQSRPVKPVEATQNYGHREELTKPSIKAQPQPTPVKNIEDSIKIPTPPVTTTPPTTSTPNGESFQNLTIAQQLDFIRGNLSTKTGQQLGIILLNVKNRIQNEIGYVSLLGPIEMTITELNVNEGPISVSLQQSTASKIEFWKKKLNL